MTWSWDSSLLSSASSTSANISKVRSFVGDVDTNWQLVTNEEIAMALSAHNVLTYAAASVARIIAASFARQANTEVSALRVSASARFRAYMALAEDLERFPGDVPGGAGGGYIDAGIFVGGAKISDKETAQDDDDLVQPSFAVGQDDNRGSSQDPVIDWDEAD